MDHSLIMNVDPRTKRFSIRKEPLDLPVPRLKVSTPSTCDPLSPFCITTSVPAEQLTILLSQFSRQIDEHYVGQPPKVEITITNLNDNVNRTFLEGLLSKYGRVEECCIFYHPKTKKHLGTAKVTFAEARAARICKEKLHQTSIMGNVVAVIEDAFGKFVWIGVKPKTHTNSLSFH